MDNVRLHGALGKNYHLARFACQVCPGRRTTSTGQFHTGNPAELSVLCVIHPELQALNPSLHILDWNKNPRPLVDKRPPTGFRAEKSRYALRVSTGLQNTPDKLGVVRQRHGLVAKLGYIPVTEATVVEILPVSVRQPQHGEERGVGAVAGGSICK